MLYNKNYKYKKSINLIIKDTFSSPSFIYSFLLFLTVIIVGIISNVFLPILFKSIVDQLYTSSWKIIWITLTFYSFIWIFSQASMQMREIARTKLELRLISSLTTRGMEKILNLPFKNFHEKRLGELTTSLERAQTALPLMLVGIFSLLIPLFFELIIVSYILLKNYPPIFNIIMFSTLIFFFIYIIKTKKRIEDVSITAIENDKIVNSKTIDYLNCYETIKAFRTEQFIISNYNDVFKKREKVIGKSRLEAALIRLGQILILGFGVVTLIFLITYNIMEGQLTSGDFILFNGYLIQFITPVSILGYNINDLRKASIEMRDLLNLLSFPKEKIIHSDSKILTTSSGAIKIKNVTFNYKDTKILDDISFEIEPGEKVVIVGSSGAGKTTIARILLNFYYPQKGEVLINSQNIQKIILNNIISYMPQDTQLIYGTIEDNVRFIAPHATQEQITNAIKAAELCQLDNKGDCSKKLSMGEKQRLGLARLFLKDSDILILDEPFASVDTETSLKIYQRMMEKFSDKTIITMTHRLLDIIQAQRIIYLHKGKIKYIGKYEELKKKKDFQKLFGLSFKKGINPKH